jgi:predicted GNAT family N-acyltransferase
MVNKANVVSFVIECFNRLEPSKMRLARHIRTVVFIEEQGVPRDLEMDEHDDNAFHFLAYDQAGKAIATARYHKTDKGIKLGRFAVLPEYRGQGAATTILSQILELLQQEESAIYLHAQSDVCSFYESFGFKKTGTPFTEAGIEHYSLVLDKEIAKDRNL